MATKRNNQMQFKILFCIVITNNIMLHLTNCIVQIIHFLPSMTKLISCLNIVNMFLMWYFMEFNNSERLGLLTDVTSIGIIDNTDKTRKHTGTLSMKAVFKIIRWKSVEFTILILV